jgi:hypothetical protein
MDDGQITQIANSPAELELDKPHKK